MTLLLQVYYRMTDSLPLVAVWLAGKVQSESLENIVADSLFPARWGLQDGAVGVEVADDSLGLLIAGNASPGDVVLDYEYVI